MVLFCLKFEVFKKGKLNFLCLLYISVELENVIYLEELLVVYWMVLVIVGEVWGVGGIDFWGVDVEEKYYIDVMVDYDFFFKIVFEFN